MNPRAALEASRTLPSGRWTASAHRLGAARELDVDPQRLALAAAARQALDRHQVAAAIAADQQQPVGALGLEHEALAVAFLVLQLGLVLEVAAQHPDPALARADHGHRLSLDRLLERLGIEQRQLGQQRPPPPERAIAELGAGRLDLGLQALTPPGLVA